MRVIRVIKTVIFILLVEQLIPLFIKNIITFNVSNKFILFSRSKIKCKGAYRRLKFPFLTEEAFKSRWSPIFMFL